MSNPTQDAALFALRGSNVRCDFSFQPDLLPSEVDAGQITQVIYNLILNAVQAMPGGGVIQIRGENIHLLANNGLSLARGDYVKLTIQDSGEGIPKQHIHKVFDPYFTTKQKGSGLGLTVVYAIMDKHDGRVTIDSDSGFGTTFSLYFPATHQIQWKPAVAETPCRSGAGNILIMDDEDFVQDLASEMLTKMGYTVTTVTSGDEAIQAYKTALAGDRGFDAVILDLTIPGGMGGKQAIKALLEMDSDIKAIVSSGYSDDPVMSNYRRYGFQNALKKPYRIKEMSEVLNSVLST